MRLSLMISVDTPRSPEAGKLTCSTSQRHGPDEVKVRWFWKDSTARGYGTGACLHGHESTKGSTSPGCYFQREMVKL